MDMDDIPPMAGPINESRNLKGGSLSDDEEFDLLSNMSKAHIDPRTTHADNEEIRMVPQEEQPPASPGRKNEMEDNLKM